MMLIQYSVNSDWLIITQARVLQAYCSIVEINEKAALNINMPNKSDTCLSTYIIVVG